VGNAPALPVVKMLVHIPRDEGDNTDQQYDHNSHFGTTENLSGDIGLLYTTFISHLTLFPALLKRKKVYSMSRYVNLNFAIKLHQYMLLSKSIW